MVPKESSDPAHDLLKAQLEQAIAAKTGRHVHSLEVLVTADRRVLVHGNTSSFYVKQLITHAVINTLTDAALGLRLDLDIRVDGG